MIGIGPFLNVFDAMGRKPNPGQRQAVQESKDGALFVVAGPGTGKTAALTMRILKLIFVDGVKPRGILATTFTKKAAAELRSRVLTWGYALQEKLQTDTKLSKITKLWLERVDINQVRTGTVDSLCEELLRDFRDPGTDPPVLADQFVSETLMLRAGFFNAKRYDDADLNEFLCDARGTGKFGWNLGTKNDLARTMWDRRHHDQLDWARWAKAGATTSERKARKLLDDALKDYDNELKSRIMVDFSQLEQTVVERLQTGGLKEFTDELDVILLDEYQDTNLLQETLYFELAKRCGGALTVVGDDDQSLYRFRGATVDLFRDFETRYAAVFKRKPAKIFLNENYRSTKTIIDFANDYATLDKAYQSVRVVGKPRLRNPKPGNVGLPVLGMFRETKQELAADLASFIHKVTRGKGYKLPGGEVLKVDTTNGGDLGDIALLCSSPREYNAADDPRLPKVLKDELAALTPKITVFNPRGQDFSGLPQVRRLGGLLLCCLDRNADAEDVVSKGLGRKICAEFQSWAQETETWLESGKAQADLVRFVNDWSTRSPGRSGYTWPKNTSAIDLLYALVHWLPELHDDPEGQVYLEVFTRQLAAAEQVSPFNARVVSDSAKKDLSLRSVGHLLLYWLAPIASGAAKVDEELIETFPRDRLNVLSIHQSKGLEFPLAIVDVGADFKRNHHGHAFKRFPAKPGPAHNLEDLMRPHSPLKKPARDGTDRAFDDLYRQYFVAFSRPQDVLLLVGLEAGLPVNSKVENIAMGYDRNGVSHWAKKLPFLEI